MTGKVGARSYSRGLKLFISFCLAVNSCYFPAYGQVRANDSTVTTEVDHVKSLYWGALDQEMPWLTEFALSEKPLQGKMWRIESSDPLSDADPFFMKSQQWTALAKNENYLQPQALQFFYRKDVRTGQLQLGLNGVSQVLSLAQPMTPLLETLDYVILSADSARFFAAKGSTEKRPGEGIFFISKKDFIAGADKANKVPVFFFALPGSGWTGLTAHAVELGHSEQIVIQNQQKDILPIPLQALAKIEDLSRSNLYVAHAWSVVEGRAEMRGTWQPKAHATIAFGTILSGQLPEMGFKGAKQTPAAFELMSVLQKLIAEPAHADEPGRLQTLRKYLSGLADTVKRWAPPTALWGATLGVAYHYSDKVNWQSLIVPDLSERVTILLGALGAIIAATTAMSLTVHKEHFKKKYDMNSGDRFLSKLNKRHKAFLDEFTHALWFSFSSIPQGLRNGLEFLKDRFFSDNHMINKAWEATMGFQLKQSSKLAMNWKTFYLGAIVMGMSDSVMVAIDLLIFLPLIFDYFGWQMSSGTGSALAAFVSAEILRNFLSYIQSGAHSYSEEVKMIHLKAIEAEVTRDMAAQNKNAELPRHKAEFDGRVKVALENRSVSLGLPSDKEFMYDPISALQATTAKLGYSAHGVEETPESEELLKKHLFILKERHWGQIKPALKKALDLAEKEAAKANTSVGQQTVALLKWALDERSLTSKVIGRTWDVLSSDWAKAEFKDSIDREIATTLADNGAMSELGYLRAVIKGGYKALCIDGTAKARDIRQVLFLMSTTGSARELMHLLPQSWREKAGSDEAAQTAAELFHRAFFAVYTENKSLLQPEAGLQTKYAAEANEIIAGQATEEPALADAFVRRVRYLGVVAALNQEAQERLAIINYRPAKKSRFAAWQMRRAQAAAQNVMQSVVDNREIAAQFSELATQYKKQQSLATLNVEEWINTNRQRFVIAQQIAKKTGLLVEDPDKSEYVRKSVLNAVLQTEEQLATAPEQVYLGTLTAEERTFYEGEVFHAHFIRHYVTQALENYDAIKGSSPEFPGRFQFVRRALVGVPGGKYMNALIRFFEAPFRNEVSAYRTGLMATLERSTPFLPDAVRNFGTILRTLPYTLSFAYLTNYYIWQIKMPYPIWFLAVSFSFVHNMFVEFNNRLMRLYDIKPMDDVASKLTYAYVHSRLTNAVYVPIGRMTEPFDAGFREYVINPTKEVMQDCKGLLQIRR